MQNIKSKTRKQKGGSGRASGGPSRRNSKSPETENNKLRRRVIELKLPDVPVSHTKPIPKLFRLANFQFYIDELRTKQIPKRNQSDENTEQIILFNLLKLQNIEHYFSSLELLHACADLLNNLVNDKIIQLNKLQLTVSDVSKVKVIDAWIEWFMNLKIVLGVEKDKIKKLI